MICVNCGNDLATEGYMLCSECLVIAWEDYYPVQQQDPTPPPGGVG